MRLFSRSRRCVQDDSRNIWCDVPPRRLGRPRCRHSISTHDSTTTNVVSLSVLKTAPPCDDKVKVNYQGEVFTPTVWRAEAGVDHIMWRSGWLAALCYGRDISRRSSVIRQKALLLARSRPSPGLQPVRATMKPSVTRFDKLQPGLISLFYEPNSISSLDLTSSACLLHLGDHPRRLERGGIRWIDHRRAGRS